MTGLMLAVEAVKALEVGRRKRRRRRKNQERFESSLVLMGLKKPRKSTLLS